MQILLLLLTAVLIAVNVLIYLQIGREEEYSKQITLGVKYLQEKDFVNAELCYKKALDIQDKKENAYLGLAAAYEGQGKKEEAQKIIKASEKFMKEREDVDFREEKQNPDGTGDTAEENGDIHSDALAPDSPDWDNPDSNPDSPDSVPIPVEEAKWREAYLPYVENWENVKAVAGNLTDYSEVGGQGNFAYEDQYFGEDFKLDTYGLADIDGNTIPELFVSSNQYSMTAVFTYSPEKEAAVYLGTYFNAFLGEEGELIEDGHERGAGALNDYTFYQLQNGTEISYITGYYDNLSASGALEHCEYKDGEIKLTEEEYWQKVQKKKISGIYLAGIAICQVGDDTCLNQYNDQELLPYPHQSNKEEKWGFISADGDWKIQPSYDSVESFNRYGVAIVMSDDNCGCIDKNGNELIPMEYVEMKINSWGVITAIQDADSPVYFNLAGEEIICPYNQKNASYLNGFYIFAENEKYGITDCLGAVTLPPDYDYIEAGNSFYAVAMKDASEGKYGYITSYMEAVPFEYDEADAFYQDYAAVCKDGKWGYINPQNEVLIPFQYDSASPMMGDFAIVQKGKSVGCINRLGKDIVPMGKYDEITGVGNYEEFCIVEKDKKQGIISKSGQEIMSVEWEQLLGMEANSDYFIRTEKKDKYGVYSSQGEELLKCEFDRIQNPVYTDEYGTLFYVEKDNEWGYIDSNKSWIIEGKK